MAPARSHKLVGLLSLDARAYSMKQDVRVNAAFCPSDGTPYFLEPDKHS
jgi:hypothetical protein